MSLGVDFYLMLMAIKASRLTDLSSSQDALNKTAYANPRRAELPRDTAIYGANWV
jgi:hypothetical protein